MSTSDVIADVITDTKFFVNQFGFFWCSVPQNLDISIGLAGRSYNSVSTAVLHFDTEALQRLMVIDGEGVEMLMQEMNGDDDDDEDKYADDMAMPGQKFETKQRITVRNLRIREDTAKVCCLVIMSTLATLK